MEGRDARRVLVVHHRGARVAQRPGADADRRRRRRRHPVRPQGRRVREGRRRARLQRRERRRGVGRDPQDHPEGAGRASWPMDEGGREHPGCQRGDDHRRAPAVPDERRRHAAVPGDQRQRLGDQEQVRQYLRVPPLTAGRTGPRDRRHARRQGGRGRRLRRGGEGLRAGAARPGLPRDRHRDRSHLRVAGGNGGLRGQDARGRGRDGRHVRDDHRQLWNHPHRSHAEDEGQGHRRQHRSF